MSSALHCLNLESLLVDWDESVCSKISKQKMYVLCDMSLFLNHNPPSVSLYLPPISLPFLLLSSPLSIFSSLSPYLSLSFFHLSLPFLISPPPFPLIPIYISLSLSLSLSLLPSLPSSFPPPPPPPPLPPSGG